MIRSLKYDWMFFQSVILMIGSALDFYSSKLFFCPLFGLFLFFGFIVSNFDKYTIHKKWGGFPNTITLTRLSLLFSVPFIETNSSLGILCLALVSLDGLDGLAARRLNQVTEFGGFLDMETDAFFCLIFSLTIAIQNPDLSWIILGGLLRYGYKIVTTFISKNGYTESKKRYARLIAGSYFLCFILYFFVDHLYSRYIISFGTALVIVSFMISFYEFLKFKKDD